jgi:hypothetical protein
VVSADNSQEVACHHLGQVVGRIYALPEPALVTKDDMPGWRRAMVLGPEAIRTDFVRGSRRSMAWGSGTSIGSST